MKTEQQALFTLTALCSQSEHCSQEMIDKMKKWQMPEDVQARIMEYLIKEKYVDDSRFAKFFINDKIKYNKWGRRKVEQALWMKNIGKEISNPIFEEISDDTYIEVLRPLIIQKSKTVKGKNEYEKTMKLIKFALGRGFDMSIIRQCIEEVEEPDDD
nr:RecX family transcriptional regulator [Prevotella sp.]